MDPGLTRKLDYADYVAAPNDGRRYEIIRGSLYVTPAPSPLHQRVSRRLLRQLADFFHERGLGEVFAAPIDLILTPHDVLQPDLLVVTSALHITRRGVERPPWLVVEILSRSTRRQDRGVKLERYAQLGVRHYWLVDPDARCIACYHLVGDRYEVLTRAEGSEVLRHAEWEGLEVRLEPLWRPSPAAGEAGS
jgi:Uma2 family endonuclease